jgi:hypothetical protein
MHSDILNLKYERFLSPTMTSKKHFGIYHIFGAVLFAMLLVFLSAPQSARACEPTQVPPGYIPPTPIPLETQVASVIHDAQFVLDGTLESWVASTNGNSILTVQVEQYLKGQGPNTVKISGYFWDCPPNFALHQGSRYTFFVNGDPTATEPLQVHGWFVSHEAVAASVRNSTGQEPIAPYGAYNVVWLSLLAFIGLGLIMFIHYRRTRF